MARRRKGLPVHGWVVVDKAEDVTSTRAVGMVRRAFNAQKAGHAGTLDPLATGVLPIALGEATKTVPYVMSGRKTYQFTVRWGQATTTDDREGQVTETSDHRPGEADIRQALPAFTGIIEQVPPAFSAIKIDGERSYDLARAGEKVELSPRPIAIYALDLVECPNADTAILAVDSGKGAYVRSLARDLARHLGTVGHASQLRRLRVGPFCAEDAIALDKLTELGHSAAALSCLKPVETALDDIPALAITGPEAQRLRRGQAISLTKMHVAQVESPGPAYASFSDQAVALGEVGGGQFRPTRVFNIPLKGKFDVDYN